MGSRSSGCRNRVANNYFFDGLTITIRLAGSALFFSGNREIRLCAKQHNSTYIINTLKSIIFKQSNFLNEFRSLFPFFQQKF